MKNISGILALPIITIRALQKHQRRLHNLVVVLLGGCAFEIGSGNPYNGLPTRTYLLIQGYCKMHQVGRQPLADLNCPSTEDIRPLHPVHSITIPTLKEILPDSQFFTISFFLGPSSPLLWQEVKQPMLLSVMLSLCYFMKTVIEEWGNRDGFCSKWCHFFHRTHPLPWIPHQLPD